jgi:site-specific DNA-methyltransferase (adenine-specific)
MTIDLRYGDTIEQMKLIPDKSIDFICCDLPYGTTACVWDIIIPFDKLWEQYKRIIKDKGVIVLTASQPFTSALVMSNPKSFKYEWIWQKTKGSNFQTLKHQPWKMHENILVFNAKGVYNPQKYTVSDDAIDKRKNVNDPLTNKDGVYGKLNRTRKKDDGTRYPSSIQLIKNPNNNSLHPTQKPLELLEYLVKTYTNEGETVLDNTMGSGTTGVACKNTNRNFIGIEKDENYFNIAVSRIKGAKPNPNNFEKVEERGLFSFTDEPDKLD